jgi:hypothetical protein
MQVEHNCHIAISLCKEDAEFARALKNALNPKLNVFIYEDEQHRLVGKSGISEFTSVFRSECKLVVILARKKYGKAGYTKLEQDAIHDRLVEEGMDMSFIVVVQMEPLGKPSWYPSSRIYASATRQSIEEIAGIIEYKLTERGVEIIPLTFEEKIDLAEQKRKDRKAHIQFLQSTESRDEALEQLEDFVKTVNKKIDSAQRRDLGVSISRRDFNSESFKTFQNTFAYVQLGDIRLRILIEMERAHPNRFTSQMIALRGIIEELEDQQYAFENGMKLHKYKIITHSEYRFSTDNKQLVGWSQIEVVNAADPNTKAGIFFGYDGLYDLKKIIPTNELVDDIFKEFFRIFEEKYPVNF